MAELVDATDSKSVVRKDVQVRFLFWAQIFSKSPVFNTGLFIFLARSLNKPAGILFLNKRFQHSYLFQTVSGIGCF